MASSQVLPLDRVEGLAHGAELECVEVVITAGDADGRRPAVYTIDVLVVEEVVHHVPFLKQLGT